MANHVKTQIRDAVVTALTGLTTTSTRVYKERPEGRPLQASELPGLCIYTGDEDQEPGTMARSSRRIIRTLQLRVRGFAKSTGDIDATLDAMAKEVETALAADVTLGGKCKDLWPLTQTKEPSGEAEQPTSMIEMVFAVEYHTAQNAPDAALA